MIKQDYVHLCTKLGFDAGVEIQRAIELHGLQEQISASHQYIIVAEEFGEIAKGIIENDRDNVKEEIVQTIAMLAKLYAVIERDSK